MFSNSTWVLTERMLTSILGFLSISAIARIMGPADYGAFAYVISVTSIFLASGHLGLDGLLIKKFIEDPTKSPAILGTVGLAKFAVLVVSGVILVSYGYLNPVHTETEQILFLAVGIMFLSAPFTSVLNAWLQAHEQFKKISMLRILVVAVSTSLKLMLIFTGYSIVSVGFAHTAIFAIEAVLVYTLFRFLSGPRIREWKFVTSFAKTLVHEAGPLFVGTILAVVYFNVDIIMLRFYHGEAIVGIYALVPQILQAVQILPLALTLVAFPRLLRLLQSEQSAFFDACKLIYARMLLLAIILGLVLFLLGGTLLVLVFGEAYQGGIPALKIACFAMPFLFIRHLTTKAFIALKLGGYFTLIEAMGLATNIGVNLLLIPTYSGAGAALATVISLSFSSVIGLFLFKQTRVLALTIVESSLGIFRIFRKLKP